MGVALKDEGKLDEAMIAFNKALIKADYDEGYLNMGNAQRSRQTRRSY